MPSGAARFSANPSAEPLAARGSMSSVRPSAVGRLGSKHVAIDQSGAAARSGWLGRSEYAYNAADEL